MTAKQIDENLIRERAYQIWERKGQPSGEDFENWYQATWELMNEIEEERQVAEAKKAKPAPARKAKEAAPKVAKSKPAKAEAPAKAEPKKAAPAPARSPISSSRSTRSTTGTGFTESADFTSSSASCRLRRRANCARYA